MNKYLSGFILFVTSLAVVVVVIMSCGKPTPPGPAPFDSDFVVEGNLIRLEAKIKSGSTISVSEAKRALKIASDLVDSRQ
jgi:hypothetical protein